MEPFIGQIIQFGGNFAPRNWAFCDGTLLSIAQYQALFSLLGTTYGGDGRTTFALPDLRGRVAIHAGSGPGLTPRPLGQKSGQENVQLSINEIPNHHHSMNAASIQAGAEGKGSTAQDTAAGNFLGNNAGGYRSAGGGGSLATGSVSGTTDNTGGSQSHNNMQPYTTINFIIALQGIYPSRN